MRIGFVTLGANVPSTRFRFMAMLPYLQAQGHEVRVWTSWPSVYEHFPAIGWRASVAVKRWTRWRQWLAARVFQPDCIYLERGVYHDSTVQMDQRFRRCTPRLVLDVDDGIFLEFPEKIPKLIAMSDHVVVATPSISQYVSQYTPNWTLVPTSVSLARYAERPNQPANASTLGALPTVGWIGTGPNVAFLEVCAPALRQLAKRIDYELLVVANDDRQLAQLDLTGVKVRFQPWQAEHEIEHLHQMDIGIMPLPEDRPWMRYKAATKLIQYLAIGIPAVASPIGVNADILKGNLVGRAASTTEQWVEHLYELLTNTYLRNQLGQCGRALVAQQFSVEANAPRLEKILTDY
ncbi:MAG: glycosyltransferase family 4 protein [Pirellulaceae bacterium]|nr:glycosyltransferase family 4 protein [Pirellulaceae bacterium]